MKIELLPEESFVFRVFSCFICFISVSLDELPDYQNCTNVPYGCCIESRKTKGINHTDRLKMLARAI